MLGKLIGIATLPVDLLSDAVTLGGSLNDTKSATLDKIDFLSGKKEFEREQDRKDLEALMDAWLRENKKENF